MQIVRIEIFRGRSREQKESLVREITDTLVEVCGVEPPRVQIIFHEMNRSDLAIGGNLYSD